MHKITVTTLLTLGGLAFGAVVPGTALAYGPKDAISDCEGRIRSEYKVTDLRNSQAEQIMDSEHHYKVQGFAKVDGNKSPWTCEVKNRHVVAAEYSGPKPKGMTTGEKLAVGAAAAAIGAAAITAANKDKGPTGAASVQDLVGVRASSGEQELEDRGYRYTSTSKSGGASYTTWRKGSSCVKVRTANGRYESLVDCQ